MDLVGLLYLANVFIGRAFHRLQLFLHVQCFAGLDISLLLKSLERIGQLAFFLLGLSQSFLYLLKFRQQSLPFG